MKSRPKIFAYLLSCALLLGASLGLRNADVVRANAETTPNSSFSKIYDSNDLYNNSSVNESLKQVLIVYDGVDHGLDDKTIYDSEVLEKVSLNDTPLSQLSGSAVISWKGYKWFRIVYPSTVTTGDILSVQSGLTVGNCVMNAFKLRLNSNDRWDYYFGEPINATYSGIYSDDFNNGDHYGTGFNRILIMYNGPKHGNPGAISSEKLKLYNGYVFIDGVNFYSLGGVTTQITAWTDQTWIQFIYPATVVSVGSVLTINSGCKVGNAVLGRMVFTLNSSEKWEITSAECTVSFKNNGGTGSMVSVSTQLGEYILPSCDFTAPNNKHFAGWKIDGTGAMLQPGTPVTLTKSISLVAQWEVTKTWATYTGIPIGWNNAHYSGTPNGYNHLLLAYGQEGVDYLAMTDNPGLDNRNADATERATADYDIGNKLTINGLSISKIREKYPSTHVGYDHGFCYLFITYPVDLLLANKNTLVPTLHIEHGAEFMDSYLPELTLKFAGGVWNYTSVADVKLDNPINLDDYLFSGSEEYPNPVTLPHLITNKSNPVLVGLPENGCQLAFTLNTGNIELNELTDVIHFAMYKYTFIIYLTSGSIQLFDGVKTLQQFNGFSFKPNTDYTFEFEITCGASSTYKLAINHFLMINYTVEENKTGASDLFAIDTSNCVSIDYYREVQTYKPVIVFDGSSHYDFIEGENAYDFASIVNTFDLYDDLINYTNLELVYEDGAVTDDKYNAGTWHLTINVIVDEVVKSTKIITINVHGNVSMAKVSYDDGEVIEVPVGTKLVAPTDPAPYKDDEHEYVFEGWYFEGGKWDFENDIVYGNMNLYSRYKEMPSRYEILVSFEGLDIPDATYLLAKGNSLPFELFEREGATFEVFAGDNKITSLVVQDNVEITVKYTVIFNHVERVAPTCTEDGNLEYWYSILYPGYYFGDAKGRELIKDPFLSKLGHDLVHLEYKDSTCSEAGNVDCYYCNHCHKHFSDENGENELINWEIAKKSHILIHHDAVEPTCSADGNVEYWTCENEPGVYYGDEAGNALLETVVIPAIGHDYGVPTYTWKEVEDGYECTASVVCEHCHEKVEETKVATKVVIRTATCSQEGQISYSVKFDNPLFNTQNKVVIIEKAPHTYVHIDEVQATKDKDGVKEHYECSECHKLFILNNGEYIEVEYSDLIIAYRNPAGCGGSITAPSLIALVSAGAFFTLVMLRRKEE